MKGTAEGVPAAIDAMVHAQSREAANEAYWRIDNHVVVQGQLFEAAEATAQVLADRICAEDFSDEGLPRALDLLVEIAWGEADQTEFELGNESLGERCRQQIRNRLPCLYRVPWGSDERVLLGLVDVIVRVDTETIRKAAFAASIAAANLSPELRSKIEKGLSSFP